MFPQRLGRQYSMRGGMMSARLQNQIADSESNCGLPVMCSRPRRRQCSGGIQLRWNFTLPLLAIRQSTATLPTVLSNSTQARLPLSTTFSGDAAQPHSATALTQAMTRSCLRKNWTCQSALRQMHRRNSARGLSRRKKEDGGFHANDLFTGELLFKGQQTTPIHRVLQQ